MIGAATVVLLSCCGVIGFAVNRAEMLIGAIAVVSFRTVASLKVIFNREH